MATQLQNIVQFVNVAAGGVATLPHDLNIDGVGQLPDLLFLPRSDFSVSANATNITVTNNGPGAASTYVYVVHWHTIDRVFGSDAITNLTPQPFILIGGGGGGGGGHRYAPPEKWHQENVPAGQANVALSALMSVSFDAIKAIRAGSIVGLSTRFTQAITDATANSAIVRVTINGVPGTLSISQSSGLNPFGGEATQAAGVDAFNAGDELGVEITTLGSFAPVTTDVESWIDLEF